MLLFFALNVEYLCAINVKKTNSEILANHHLYKLVEDIDKIFTGFCKQLNHKDELNYFCKTHNILCCAQCIVKIKDKINGHHHDCDICFIQDIVEEKRKYLKENINTLENLSKNILESIKLLISQKNHLFYI